MPPFQSVSRVIMGLLAILAFLLLLLIMFMAKIAFSLRLYLIILFILWTTYLSFPVLAAITTTTTINPVHIGILFAAFIGAFVLLTIAQLSYLDSSSPDDTEPRQPVVLMSTQLKKRNVQMYYIETLGFFALFSLLLLGFRQPTTNTPNASSPPTTNNPANHILSLALLIFIYVFIFIYCMPFFYSINDIFTGNLADHFGSESSLFLQMLFNRHKQSEMFQKYAYYSISTNC